MFSPSFTPYLNENRAKLYFFLRIFKRFHGENSPDEGEKTGPYLMFDMQHSVDISAGAGVISQIAAVGLIVPGCKQTLHMF